MESNVQKMREALTDLCNAALKVIVLRGHDAEDLRSLGFYMDKANLALAKPPRNCDVGTALEQTDRFWGYCNAHSCNECPARGGWRTVYIDGTSFKMIQCGVLWAQMPYESGAAK